MELRWDLMHRSPSGGCVISVVVTDDEAETEDRFLLEVDVEDEALAFTPYGDLADMFETYNENESPEALEGDDAVAWRVAHLVDHFVGRLAESGLLDLLSDEEEDEEVEGQA
ncbi:hypothetical protein L6R50_11710 [Myxococcota bacterium]|nr:hypothetical protein [Myxococcota bacterium]